MTDFIVNNLSKERWKTYRDLSLATAIAPEDLYIRNLTYSKELYVILSGLEVVVRNRFHFELAKKFQKENWMLNEGLLRTSHKEQLNKAIEKLSRHKSGSYQIPDLIAELNFGFWIHLLDAPYEQALGIPSLRFAFPSKFGRPVRQDIESRLKNLLRMRNKIAHLEPIIRQEVQLIQVYQNAYDILSWICPQTADWFDRSNNFKSIWKQNNQMPTASGEKI